MSLPKNVASIDLGSLPRPVTLDLLDASAGSSVTAYRDPYGRSRWTLPVAVQDSDDDVVKFYVDADEVWLSAKVNTHEIAGDAGTTKHVVTDTHRPDAAPAVRLEWDADRLDQTAPSGGSVPVSRLVARLTAPVTLPALGQYDLQPSDLTVISQVGGDAAPTVDDDWGVISLHAEGNYTVSAWANCTPGTADARLNFAPVASADGGLSNPSPDCMSDVLMTDTDGRSGGSFSVTAHFIPPDDGIGIRITNYSDVDDVTLSSLQVFVVRVG